MASRVARLAFILFDPRSHDGFISWKILDAILGATPSPGALPVLRTMDLIPK